MNELFEKFLALDFDKSLLNLEQDSQPEPYFCYPIGAKPIGYEGCILYCFIPQYGEMVFASNPETCVDDNVYPLAENFEDFIRLVLACGSPNPPEQIVWMSKERFEDHRKETLDSLTDQQKAALDKLARQLNLAPMENPYEYVKQVQSGFDSSKIQFTDEYYDIKGLVR